MIANSTVNSVKKLFSGIAIKITFIVVTAYLSLIGIGLLYSDALIFLPPTVSYQNTDDLISIPSESAEEKGARHNIIVRYRHNPKAEYTVLYSHGNAVDIGGLTNLQQKFIDHGYSIAFYDYSGYGLSESQPSEQQAYNDVQAVYDYLTQQLKLDPGKILSYGHSLGSAIATNLALENPVAGLILESPFTTAFRVKTVYQIVPFDKFASIEKIDKINVPVFITHSKDDPVIAFWHGTSLFQQANEPKFSLWFDHQGHSGITHTELFWSGLKHFVSELN